MAVFSAYEDFDYVTAPAMPSDWTASSGLVTSTTRSISASNSLLDSGGGVPRGLGYTTGDSLGGQVLAAYLDVWLTGTPSSGTIYGGIAFRCSTTSVGSTAINRYYVYLASDADVGDYVSFERDNGTTLATAITVGAGLTAGWYRIGLTAVGSTFTAYFRKRSNGNYLSSGGTFGSSFANAFSLTNTVYSSGTYFGVISQSAGGQSVYLDSFEYTSADPATGTTIIFPRHRKFLRVGQVVRRRRRAIPISVTTMTTNLVINRRRKVR